MNSRLRDLSIIVVSVLMYACTAGKTATQSSSRVYPLGDSSSITDGSLIYALPMTVFNITFELERKINIPGPYSKYAADMLGLKDVITTQDESWSITSVTINIREELDPSEYYVIECNTATLANALKLKKVGLILDINPSLYLHNNLSQVSGGIDDNFRGFRDLGADEYFVSQNDTLYRTVRLDSSFVKIPYLVEKKKILTQEQLAEKAAKSLLELRDGKHSILTGEANVFPQSSAAIDEINKLEKELTELFTGKTLAEHKTVTYTVIPKKETAASPVTLFRFSKQEGILPLSSVSGMLVVAELEPAHKTKDITIIPRSLAEGEKRQDFDKLYYRLPDVATIKVKMGNQVLFESRKLVDQFGEILQLPANYIIGD